MFNILNLCMRIIDICTNIEITHSWYGYDDSSLYPSIVRSTTMYPTFSYIAIVFDNEITINRSTIFPSIGNINK